jgi:hypothetical protein
VKRPGTFRKVAAVVSSVLLAAGFICYQAGAFNRFIAPTPPETSMSSSKYKVLDLHGKFDGYFTPPASATTPQPLTIMASSKSAIVVNPPPATKSAPTIIGGSKSFFPQPMQVDLGKTGGQPPPATAQQPPPPATKPEPTIMPSSKSGYHRPFRIIP